MQTLPGLAHHGCQPPMKAAGPCLPYKKAPGTLHYHTMFSDWEIVPWAHCTEPASTQNWCYFIRLPKLSCPGPLDRTIMTPLPLQPVSVAALTHPTGLMVAKACRLTPQSSTAGVPGDAIGETRTASLGDTG